LLGDEKDGCAALSRVARSGAEAIDFVRCGRPPCRGTRPGSWPRGPLADVKRKHPGKWRAFPCATSVRPVARDDGTSWVCVAPTRVGLGVGLLGDPGASCWTRPCHRELQGLVYGMANTDDSVAVSHAPAVLGGLVLVGALALTIVFW